MLPRSESPPPEAELLKKHKHSSSTAAGDSPASNPDHPGKSAAAAKHLQFHLPPCHRAGLVLVILVLQLLLLFAARSIPGPRLHLLRHRPPIPPSAATSAPAPCAAGMVYVHDLPPMFHKDLLAACDDLNPWASRCAALSNGGFGPPAADLAGVIPSSLLPSWYSTDQFAAEIIFHRRMLAHRCRARDPSAAAAFYVPFYGGLAVGRHLWSPNSTSGDRDRDCALLLRWVRDQPPWRRSNGWDHFIVLGRITWDFRRSREGDWGGSFLYMPGMENVTRLLIERNPWDEKDVGIPYPTGFHPRTAAQVREWQRFVLGRSRSKLFSFAGAARAGFKDDFRGLLLGECRRAGGQCRTVDCSGGRCGNRSAETLSLFLDSTFCLQPRGDSFTRRSMFDCMVAGAVPVLFWRRSAYVQYRWYLPAGEEWSVFIDRREVRSGAVSVRGVLEGIGVERAKKMREKVVELIPRLVYAAAEGGLGEGMEDAFDVAVDGVLRRFRDRRRRTGEAETVLGEFE
ncbi:xyloglucan galactosyltransferase XLT2 [Phoenix dactylifera]|uniref:Xyloglucan galactosyltransferase XLT2 n=1 Tax=Phoenix dactylifera TaxID=42345 RepID=A0A8B7BKT2_PHODC|nr:xyloglucan galactosyltransferase XLT2 [Phoenix dactylifera]